LILAHIKECIQLGGRARRDAITVSSGLAVGTDMVKPESLRRVAVGLTWVSARVDISYAAPQLHRIVNVALHQEYSSDMVFTFSQGRKDLYHV
jgi:hypothetical protein